MGNIQGNQGNQGNQGHHRRQDKETLRLIEEMKDKLHQMKLKGTEDRNAREEEIYALQMELYEKKKKLMEKANQAQEVFSFGDYINVIQTTFTSDKIATKPVQTIIPDDGVRPKTTDIVPQYFTLTYTIFAWFEAYLLKRLHMAMLQQRQQAIHAKSWSGVVADLFFEIPQLKKNLDTKLGSLFVRKQTVEMEKHQKQDAYAEHVRIQASTIMKLERASWNLPSNRRASLPTTIDVSSHHGDAARVSGIGTTIRFSGLPTERTSPIGFDDPVGSGRISPAVMTRHQSGVSQQTRPSFYSADSDPSQGVSTLRTEINNIKESSPTTSRRSQTSSPFDGFESELSTSSSEEEDSIYEEATEDEFNASNMSGFAVKELIPQGHRVSSMTVPGGLHWHAQISKEEREALRKEAEMENARLERERFLRKTQELRRNRSFDDEEIDMAKIAAGDTEEIQRMKRLQGQRESREKARLERAAFKAQRLRDLQDRLSRASNHSATTPRISDITVLSTSGESSERPRPSATMNDLAEKIDEEEGDTTTAAETTLSKSPKKATKKKKKKVPTTALDDDPSVQSVQSNASSSRSRKSAKRKSLLEAERKAQEKMKALSQVMASETLESYVQEKEEEEKATAAQDISLLLSPGVESVASRRSLRRSMRLEETIRKAEEKANTQLQELALLTDFSD